MPLEAGLYRIISAKVELAVDLANGKSDDLTNVIGFKNHGGAMQLWAIRPVGNGSDEYTIRNYMGGSYLQLGGSPPVNGPLVVGFHYTGAPNQRWHIRQPDDLYFKIQSVATGAFLDLLGVDEKGTTIEGRAGDWTTPSTQGNQSWKFVRTGYI